MSGLLLIGVEDQSYGDVEVEMADDADEMFTEKAAVLTLLVMDIHARD